MKKLRLVLTGIAFILVSTFIVHAQETTDSASDLAVKLQALEQTTPIPASELPQYGTFWSAQHAPGSTNEWPPLPGNIFGFDAWPLGDGVYLLDDTNIDYAVLAAAASAAQPQLSRGGMSPMFSLISGSGGTPVYLTNLVAMLTNGSVTVTFSIAGGTNGFAYDIYNTTNLTNSPIYSQWTWLGQGYTFNSYTFTNQPNDNAFYTLAIPRQTMVVAWGDDSDGQCNVPPGLTNAIDVAGGFNFSLALKADGTVVTWGDNTYGQTNVPAGLTNVIALAAGAYHAVALKADDTVVQWATIGTAVIFMPSARPPATQILWPLPPGADMTLG